MRVQPCGHAHAKCRFEVAATVAATECVTLTADWNR